MIDLGHGAMLRCCFDFDRLQGLHLKQGKKMENLSFESQTEFRDWKDAIERVLGIGGVEELLSEDEEEQDAIAGTKCVCVCVCVCVYVCVRVSVCVSVCECVSE